jgi:hypothetical protein
MTRATVDASAGPIRWLIHTGRSSSDARGSNLHHDRVRETAAMTRSATSPADRLARVLEYPKPGGLGVHDQFLNGRGTVGLR